MEEEEEKEKEKKEEEKEEKKKEEELVQPTGALTLRCPNVGCTNSLEF